MQWQSASNHCACAHELWAESVGVQSTKNTLAHPCAPVTPNMDSSALAAACNTATLTTVICTEGEKNMRGKQNDGGHMAAHLYAEQMSNIGM